MVRKSTQNKPKERLCSHPKMGKGRSDLPAKTKHIMG